MSSFRSYGTRVSFGGALTPAIKALLIASAAVFLLQTIAGLLSAEYGALLLTGFGLVPRGVTHGLRIWQPFTYLFLHGGLWHLLFNMLALWMFGGDVERVFGTRRFYSYYFIAGVGAGLVNIVVKTIADPAGTGSALVPTIGASGAIYGILMASALLFPERQVWLFPFPVMVPMRVYAMIIGAIAFFGSLGASGDGISHLSHLSGMLIGWLYLRRGSFFYSLRNRLSDWQRRRMRRKFEVYMRDKRDEPPSHPDRWVN